MAPFGFLVGTEKEVAAIGEKFAKQEDRQVESLTGRTATESRIRSAAAGKRLIHLATHAFFATGQMRSSLDAIPDEHSRFAIEGEPQAGRNPTVVDVDVFALQNCYEVNYVPDPGRVVALLNIGASIMNINVVKDGLSVFNRDIAVGGNQYTDAIQKDLNLSFEQAEALKRGEHIDEASPESLHPILQAVSENIATEIQRTFDFFRATSQEDRVDQIYLSGGAANVHGLRDLLADRLDAPVELLNPFLNVRYSEKDFDPAFLDDIGPSAAIAVGLAVRRVGDR